MISPPTNPCTENDTFRLMTREAESLQFLEVFPDVSRLRLGPIGLLFVVLGILRDTGVNLVLLVFILQVQIVLYFGLCPGHPNDPPFLLAWFRLGVGIKQQLLIFNSESSRRLLNLLKQCSCNIPIFPQELPLTLNLFEKLSQLTLVFMVETRAHCLIPHELVNQGISLYHQLLLPLCSLVLLQVVTFLT